MLVLATYPFSAELEPPMSVLQFIDSMAGHLAWPLVVVVLLILMRKHLGVLADRIEEFSFGGAKFTWKKKLEEGAKIIEQEPELQVTPPNPNEQIGPKDSLVPILPELAEDRENMRRAGVGRAILASSPFGQVLVGLDEVDKLLFEIADLMGVDPAVPLSVMYSLVAHGNVPPSIGKLYDTLRDARNILVHSPSLPNEKEAAEYLRQTYYIKSALLSVLAELSSKKERKQEE